MCACACSCVCKHIEKKSGRTQKPIAMVTSKESRQRGSKRDSGQEKGLLLVSQYTMQLNFYKNAVMLIIYNFLKFNICTN